MAQKKLIKIDERCINPLVADIGESDTLAINERSRQLLLKGKTVYRFGLGQSPFPVPESVVEALRLNAAQKDYLHVKGLPLLRNTVAEFHRKKDDVTADPECVLIGPGSKELVFLLQLVFNGEIIIVSPCWVSYIPQAQILDKQISVIHSSFEDKWQLTPILFREFTEKRKTKMPALMILNYPGNPNGVTFSAAHLKEIAAIAKANNILILSDEIYGQLHHEGKHVSIGRFYPEGTIISSGLSKWCGAGGWRLGTFTFPTQLKWLSDKMSAVASETYTSVSAPIQYAAVEAFRGGTGIEEYLWHVRKILRALGEKLTSIFHEAGIKVHKPEGGFYLLVDMEAHADTLAGRNIFTSKQLCEVLMEETGVAILPGSSFNRPAEELTARLAYVDFDGAAALATARTIQLSQELPTDFLITYCPRVIEGARILTQWLKNNLIKP